MPIRLFQTGPVPWKALLKSKAVWALIAAHSGHIWGNDTLLLELPTYLRNIMGISVSQSGLISAIPFLFQAIFAWVAAFAADLFLRAQYLSVPAVRKGWNSLAFCGAAMCMLCLTFAGCNYLLVTYMVFLAMGFDGISRAGFFVNHMDISPDFAGTLMGLTNSIGCMNGFIVPYIVAVLTQNNQTSYQWSFLFAIACAIYLLTALIFVVFGSTEIQSWGAVSLPMTTVSYTNPKDSLVEARHSNDQDNTSTSSH